MPIRVQHYLGLQHRTPMHITSYKKTVKGPFCDPQHHPLILVRLIYWKPLYALSLSEKYFWQIYLYFLQIW